MKRFLVIGAILFVTGLVAFFLLFDRENTEVHRVGKGSPSICTRLPPITPKQNDEFLLPNEERRWKSNAILKVYFSSGDRKLRDRVISVASEWSKHSTIKFTETAYPGLADIRITFKYGGYGSLVGKESKEIMNVSKHSMFLQGLDTLRDNQEFFRVVLHEFGHALAIEHELQKPSAQIKWNKSAVYDYYKKNHGWNETKVDANIFRIIDSGSKYYSAFDSTSIMGYAVPAELTTDGREIPWPKKLSKTDMRDIAKFYSNN